MATHEEALNQHAGCTGHLGGNVGFWGVEGVTCLPLPHMRKHETNIQKLGGIEGTIWGGGGVVPAFATIEEALNKIM